MAPDIKRGFKGIWIPRDLWLDPTLSVTQKVLLAEIDSLDGDEGCFATNLYFANFLRCDKMYVSQLISQLVEAEWIWLESFDGRRRVLRSNLNKIYGTRVITQIKQVEVPAMTAIEEAAAQGDAMLVLRQLDGFLEMWQAWKEHRKQLRAPMTKKAEKMILDDLLGFHKQGIDVVDAMRQSITSGWKKVFPKVGATKNNLNGAEKISKEGFGELA